MNRVKYPVARIEKEYTRDNYQRGEWPVDQVEERGERERIRELQKRKPASKDEQFKIDYCTLTYDNKLENLSILLDKPINNGTDKSIPDPTKTYSPTELLALIHRYVNFQDLVECELLVEYVDYALDAIKSTEDKQSVRSLANELVKLGL